MRWKENLDTSLRRRGTSLLEVERDGLFEDRQQWREILMQGN